MERGEDCLLTLGHACCWVDDVVLERPALEEYSQLKTSPTETWGRDGGRLIQQCRNQATHCRKRGVRFTLQIVTPHQDRRRHFEAEMPEGLHAVTEIVLFRDEPLGWGRDSPVADALVALCAVAPEASVRELVLRTLVAQYHWLRRTSTALRVSDYIAAVASDERLPLRSRAVVADSALWSSVLLALSETLPGLRLVVTEGFLVYEYLDDERGFVARADSDCTTRFLSRLAERPPTTISAFHQELP